MSVLVVSWSSVGSVEISPAENVASPVSSWGWRTEEGMQAEVVLRTERLEWQELTTSFSPLMMLMVTGSARRLHLSLPPHSLRTCEVRLRSPHCSPEVGSSLEMNYKDITLMSGVSQSGHEIWNILSFEREKCKNLVCGLDGEVVLERNITLVTW